MGLELALPGNYDWQMKKTAQEKQEHQQKITAIVNELGSTEDGTDGRRLSADT
jgi:hypothetical protein